MLHVAGRDIFAYASKSKGRWKNENENYKVTLR